MADTTLNPGATPGDLAPTYNRIKTVCEYLYMVDARLAAVGNPTASMSAQSLQGIATALTLCLMEIEKWQPTVLLPPSPPSSSPPST